MYGLLYGRKVKLGPGQSLVNDTLIIALLVGFNIDARKRISIERELAIAIAAFA
jgi:hypothetical protein